MKVCPYCQTKVNELARHIVMSALFVAVWVGVFGLLLVSCIIHKIFKCISGIGY